MAEFHVQCWHVLWVNSGVSPSICVGVVEGWTGVIEAFQLFCSMLGEPYVQREEVRWRTPSRDASFS